MWIKLWSEKWFKDCINYWKDMKMTKSIDYFLKLGRRWQKHQLQRPSSTNMCPNVTFNMSYADKNSTVSILYLAPSAPKPRNNRWLAVTDCNIWSSDCERNAHNAQRFSTWHKSKFFCVLAETANPWSYRPIRPRVWDNTTAFGANFRTTRKAELVSTTERHEVNYRLSEHHAA